MGGIGALVWWVARGGSVHDSARSRDGQQRSNKYGLRYMCGRYGARKNHHTRNIMCRLVSGRQKKKKKKERHEMQRSRTSKKEEGPALKADGENDLWKGRSNKKENCKGHFTNGGGRRDDGD